MTDYQLNETDLISHLAVLLGQAIGRMESNMSVEKICAGCALTIRTVATLYRMEKDGATDEELMDKLKDFQQKLDRSSPKKEE